MSKDEPQFGVSPVELAHSNQTSTTDLREQITAVVTSYTFAEDSLVNELMQLIESSQAAAVQAARVDELIKVREIVGGEYDPEGWYGELVDRLAQLKAEANHES